MVQKETQSYEGSWCHLMRKIQDDVKEEGSIHIWR